MIEHILWIISFFSLWMVLIWLQIIYLEEPKKNKIDDIPLVTIAIAAYNEEKTIRKTVNSIVNSEYPAGKIEIIVVNDGSRDKTANVVKKLIKKHKGFRILLINKENGGKASAINVALKNAKGEMFGVVDADSKIEPNCLKLLVPHFDDEKIGAVVSRIRVDMPKGILEKMQRFEYVMSNMIRNLMSRIGTLALTPGVLSVYRTKVVKKLGGFDENRANLTEDLEIAMRLKYHGWKIKMESQSITHTLVPPNLNRLWRQRIRWSRGFIYNHLKYKRMFFSKKHALFGLFQMPVNVLVVLLLIVNIGIIGYSLLNNTLEFAIRSATIDGYFINSVMTMPSVHDVLLSQNVRVMIPIFICALLGFYLIIITHRIFKENLSENIVPIITYFVFLPYFTTLNWISSVTQEILRTKKKW